jgi:hypothetical protein
VYTGDSTNMGVVASSVGTYDFTAPGERAWQLLLSVEDTTYSCLSDTVTVASLEKIEFLDLNNDGMPDLRVTVRWADKIKVPARYKENCHDGFEPPQAPLRRIDFLFDGKEFHVAPGSAKTLKLVNAL